MFSRKVYFGNGTFSVPAGVTKVKVLLTKKIAGFPNPEGANNGGPPQDGVFLPDYNGNLYAWGDNVNGSLGVNDTTPRSSPTLVVGALTFRDIITHPNQTIFGITSSNVLYAWGRNNGGMLGSNSDPTVTSRVSSPIAVVGVNGIVRVAVGVNTTVNWATAMDTTGALYAWGQNTNGQLGVGDVTPRSSPTLVLGGFVFQDVIATQQCTYGLTSGGNIYAWGINTNGQLGVGDVTPRSSPVLVLGGLTFSKMFSNGGNFMTAMDTSGNLYAWGANASGQLGVGDTTPRSSPVLVLGGFKFLQVFPFNSQILAIANNGNTYAWGSNGSGSLGVGDVTGRSSPVLVLGGLLFSKIARSTINGINRIGLTTSGDLYAWGQNVSGQLGVGDVTPRSSPVLVLGGFKYADAFTVGIASYGVTVDGAVYAWGLNASGKLGTAQDPATTLAVSSPVLVVGSQIANLTPLSTTTLITVVPGTSYKIDFGRAFAAFGNTVIEGQYPTSMVVEFEQ